MKIPVTIFTGFLGSGKTTLINSLLKLQTNERIAILVNEFGEVDVDGSTIKNTSPDFAGKVYELPGGCVCSAMDENFADQVKGLLESKYEFDHIILETSGLGVPMPIVSAMRQEGLKEHLELDAILAVVDTPLLLEEDSLSGGEDATYKILDEQLEYADVVILNKVDDLEGDNLLEAEQLVRKKAKALRFLEVAYNASLDPRLCLGLQVHDKSPKHHHHHHHHHHGPVSQTPGDGEGPLADQTIVDGHEHDDLGAHEHSDDTHMHFHEHDSGWQSFVLHTHKPQDKGTLLAALEKVTKEEPVLRAKGNAYSDSEAWNIQVVRTRVDMAVEKVSEEGKASKMVFIGYRPNRKNVAQILQDVTGTNWH